MPIVRTPSNPAAAEKKPLTDSAGTEVSVPLGAFGEGGGDGRGGNGLSTVPGGKLLKAKHTHKNT